MPWKPGTVEQVFLGESKGSAAGLPVRFLTRHGIIAGSTGTGKSRAMQVLAEQLADAGVHVFVSDVKGDASGFCVAGGESGRNKLAPFEPHALAANYWSVGSRFTPLRFSVSQCGSVLLSRLLSLNPTQESHLSIAFSYAKKADLPLDTLEDLLEVLDALVATQQRGISPPSVSVIQRKVISLQESGAGELFGMPAAKLQDLGGLNVLNLSDARRDMSVAMAPAFLLNKLFGMLPEAGDLAVPKFAIFFDEAHYLFKDSNKSLRDLMATILKQIRSKGVSVFFVTQDVSDIPEEILSQLSTKIIFSQKAMTEKGNARLRALAKSFPKSDMDVMERLKAMPPGTALLSSLDEKGNQAPPLEVRVFAPATTMSVVPDEELRKATDLKLLAKYSKKAARKSATRAKTSVPAAQAAKPASSQKPEAPPRPLPKPEPRSQPRERRAEQRTGPSVWDGIFGFLLKLLDFLLKALGKILSFAIFRPAKGYFSWMMKKKVRIIYTLLFLLLLYVLIVNWPIIEAFLAALKFS